MTHYISRIMGAVLSAVLVLCSCENGFIGSESPAERAVDSFATAYFNYQFATAIQYSTPESHRWIEFVASNVHQDDVDSLRQHPTAAQVEVDEVEAADEDTVGYALITVSDYFLMDSIGDVSSLRTADTYRLDMTKRRGRWLIHLAAPLRPEKQE